MNDPYYWQEQAVPSQAVEHPQATTVLLLGVLSVFCCGALGPVAWVLGKRAMDQIEASQGALGGRTQVLVGYILGVVGTILMALIGILFFLMVLGGNADGNA
ncbi:DUF4190 domain-containing protein [Nocardia sp. BMG51109]|uniref:DUF4190 domain-containing protein n=1 Tax=Nocardia sp. BMG51109 TaxID=1056816 RepID=UPI0004652E3F|nr:DUF4190 domain-containing protein [Nocardia sp. BMG51109]